MRQSHMQMSKFAVLVCFSLVFYCQTSHAQSGTGIQLEAFRSHWVGQYPHKGKTFFLKEPKIEKTSRLVLDKKQLDAIASGEYLESPIDYVAGYYVLSFAANPRLMEESGWIYVIVREHTGSMHVATKDSKGRVGWKHSAERDLPPQILKMLDLSGTEK